MEVGISPEAQAKQKEFLTFLETGVRKDDPQKLQRTKDKESLAQGGKSLMVRRELERGITDQEEIKANLKLTTQQLADVRKTGVDVPRMHRDWKKIGEQIEKESDDVKLQKILDDFKYGEITRFMDNNREQKLFMHLRKFTSVKEMQPIAEKLRESGISVGRYSRFVKGKEEPVVTWVVYDKHKWRIAGQLASSGSVGK